MSTPLRLLSTRTGHGVSLNVVSILNLGARREKRRPGLNWTTTPETSPFRRNSTVFYHVTLSTNLLKLLFKISYLVHT